MTDAVHGTWLSHLWFLRGAEPGCLVQLTGLMEPRIVCAAGAPTSVNLGIRALCRPGPHARSAIPSRAQFAPGEVPERKHFYVLQRGVVLYSARVLTAGKSWGEDFILSNDKNLSPAIARGRANGIRSRSQSVLRFHAFAVARTSARLPHHSMPQVA